MSSIAQSRRSSFGQLFKATFSAGRIPDALLAILAVAVISLMVLPLPPAMLDLLISINIGLSVMLLMLALYVHTPLGLSTFPTLLLFTTLLRLSLNIASTRAILLRADAGQIIDTFGQLVVGGSIIVGIVVFLIIAIVQFIVIAKGAERVAEVGARFTLDALPGKQMSIDAELRAGIIDKDESRSKRDTLQRESQLYGAMDGAMKFVKGDAIAGLLIALVNIVAGISVGVGMHEMAFSDAASTYTILTVGDGLVSQIPSLFVSLAAGILITRVSGSDSLVPPSLGEQIGAQIAAQPKALLVTATVLGLFLLVPGFPKLQFLAWAGVFAVSGFLLIRTAKAKKTVDPMLMAALHRDGIARPRSSEDLSAELVNSYGLSMQLSTSLLPYVEDGSLSRMVEQARNSVTLRLGVPFPGIGISLSDRLRENQFLIMVNEVPAMAGQVRPDQVYTQSSTAQLLSAGVATEPVSGAGNDGASAPGSWLPASQIPALDRAGLSYLDTVNVMGRSLNRVLNDNAHQFVGMQETKFLLNEAEKAFPDLVVEASRGVPLSRITDVLRRLVEEKISIRNMRDILQALLEWSPKEKDPILLSELVRTALAPQITYQFGGVSKTLQVLTFQRALEERLRAAITSNVTGNYIDLEPRYMDELTAAVANKVRNVKPMEGVAPVVLVSLDIRRYVRQIIASTLPDLPVISYQSLTPDAKVRPFGELQDPRPPELPPKGTK